ncbi:MAG: methyltransferase [Betaproteobacteria bacterium RIFCSPLOWO2_02_FULL_66_14]|nr:MAG: methyltransferase [Betaproteobacteria bacterium RIFCSPLOWO2_02_FULL_66_14]
MSDALQQLKTELERFGAANDAAVAERSRRMLNITRDTGELLAVLVRAAVARRVLEIGTSNGYSTLWLAEAAQSIGGEVTTVERSDLKVAMARANFERSGLSAAIRQVHAAAGDVLARTARESVDLLFLDSERSEYCAWWPEVDRVLRSGGLLVADNAVSHAAEMAEFVALVRSRSGWASCLVPIGNGEFLAVKNAREP